MNESEKQLTLVSKSQCAMSVSCSTQLILLTIFMILVAHRYHYMAANISSANNKQREYSKVIASNNISEMKALQHKIQVSRIKADALNTQQTKRQEEVENCVDAKELLRVKR